MPSRSPWGPFLGTACLAVMSSGWLRAQTPPVPPEPQPAATTATPTPAITVLLRAERSLDAERFRRRLARVLQVEVGTAASDAVPFVIADGAAIVGGREGVRWRLTPTKTALALPDAALAHLDDEERQALRAHVAALVVQVTTPVADDASRTAAYRQLGGVAAALLGRDVLGLGAAQHGTFDSYDTDDEADQRAALLEDPLSALAPVARTSLALFLRTPRTLDAAALRQALGKEFAVVFGTPDDDAENFVVGADELMFVWLGEQMVVVELGPASNPPAEQLQRYDDLRIRSLLAEHRQLLRLSVGGAVGAAAEAERRRLVARTAAALWGEDVLGLSWHCDLRLVPSSADVVANLRHGDPVVATLGDRVVPVVEARDQAAMERAIAAARTSWGEAVAHLRAGGELSAKFPFATRAGSVEHIWVAVRSVDGELVRGVLANEPRDLAGLKLGSAVECKVAELSDWLFLRDGAMVGGYTVKVLDEQAKAKAKENAGEVQPAPKTEPKPAGKPATGGK